MMGNGANVFASSHIPTTGGGREMSDCGRIHAYIAFTFSQIDECARFLYSYTTKHGKRKIFNLQAYITYKLSWTRRMYKQSSVWCNV